MVLAKTHARVNVRYFPVNVYVIVTVRVYGIRLSQSLYIQTNDFSLTIYGRFSFNGQNFCLYINGNNWPTRSLISRENGASNLKDLFP